MNNYFDHNNDFSKGYRILDKRYIGVWSYISIPSPSPAPAVPAPVPVAQPTSTPSVFVPDLSGLPSSGPISLDDIQTEFGGTNPIAISEYYGAATGVPASGTISISDFYGTSAGFPPVTLGYWAGGQGAAQTNTIRRIQYSNDTVSLRPATLPSGTSAGVALQDTTNAFIVEGRNGPNSPNNPTGGNIMKFQFSN